MDLAGDSVNRPDVRPVNGVDTLGWCHFETSKEYSGMKNVMVALVAAAFASVALAQGTTAAAPAMQAAPAAQAAPATQHWPSNSEARKEKKAKKKANKKASHSATAPATSTTPAATSTAEKPAK